MCMNTIYTYNSCKEDTSTLLKMLQLRIASGKYR